MTITQQSNLTLADLHGTHKGQTVIIAGNGPSLLGYRMQNRREVPPTDWTRCRELADVIMGTNRAFLWGPLDWWVIIDQEPYRKGTGKPASPSVHQNLKNAAWALNRHKAPQHPHDPGRVLHFHQHQVNGKRQLLIEPGMRSMHYCETGTYHGHGLHRNQAAKVKPGSLYMHNSVSMTALHLSLILGFERIILVGCDLQFPRGGGRQFYNARADGSGMMVHDQQLIKNRRQLEKFYEQWRLEVALFQATPDAAPCGWPSVPLSELD